jgi:hypothetical protein
MADLPTNLDATFVDDPDNPGRKQHQQHHDSVHAGINSLFHAHAAAVTAGFVGDLEAWLKTLDDVLDHGSLTGLADDDHPQYVLHTEGDAAYVAKVGSVEWASASALIATFGAPTLAGVGAAGDKTSLAWLLDATATENVTGQVLIPPGWATADIVLWWTNAGTGTGSVRWALLHEAQISGGDTLGGALSANDAVSSTAPAQNVVKVEFLKTAVAVAPGQVLGFRVQRLGGHADDTLANDVGLLGIEIRRAS